MGHQPLIGSMLPAATGSAQRGAAQQTRPAGCYEQEPGTGKNEREWHTRATTCARHTSVLQDLLGAEAAASQEVHPSNISW